MAKFLDDNGLLYFWQKIVSKFVAKEDGKGLSSNDYTTTEKSKLAGIASGANKYTLPNATASTLGGVKIGTNVNVSSGTISVADGSTSAKGVVQLTDGTTSTSTTTAATPNSVKTVADKLSDHEDDEIAHVTVIDRTYWTAKQDFLTFDTTPTASSTNPVTSGGVKTALDGKAAKATTLSGYGITDAYTKTAVDSLITNLNTAISKVYTPCGSSETVPTTLSTLDVGSVYNITAAFTTTSSFVEGAGKTFPAGTNIVVVDVSGTKKWDVLAGMVDLSGYVPTSATITNAEIDTIVAS